jgi:2-keto-4-pentenoate hydratase
LAANVLAGVASEPLAVTSMEDGLCAQEKLVAILEKRWGKPIGYKAALTSEAAQRNFGVREPVRGVLLADIMLKNGAPAKFGALPRYEADLIVIVADSKSPLMRVSSHSPLKPNMAPT